MYKYVEDKQFLSRMRSLCGEIMQDLCHTLKEEYDIGASFYLVGSGARNLILQNANQPIDLDYNLEITRIDDWEDCKEIKECVRKAFNIVLREYGWSDCQDSTSSLTTEKRHFNQGNSTEFSMDICIVCEDTDGNYHRLIHDEDNMTYNPDGKAIIARDNEISIRRKEDISKAYFNCHTDITIPYDELGAITVVRADGTMTDIIRNGRFVVPGTEPLNEPLDAMEP